MYELVYTKEALKGITKLSGKDKKKLKHSLEMLASDPRLGKALQHELRGLWSYRTGSYCIIYEVHDKILKILILTVSHRRDVYDQLKRR